VYVFFQISASPISDADFISKIADELVRQNQRKKDGIEFLREKTKNSDRPPV